MDSPRAFWPEWTSFLRRRGLDQIAAWFLEAGGPLNLVGAQILYMGQPMVSPEISQRLQALAQLLEEEEETHSFVAFLKGNHP